MPFVGHGQRARLYPLANGRGKGHAMSKPLSETASLGGKIATKRAGRLATTPESAKGHFVAAWAGKCSPRRAIKAQCLECVGFDRQAITDRKSTRLNSSHRCISYAVFC